MIGQATAGLSATCSRRAISWWRHLAHASPLPTPAPQCSKLVCGPTSKSRRNPSNPCSPRPPEAVWIRVTETRQDPLALLSRKCRAHAPHRAARLALSRRSTMSSISDETPHCTARECRVGNEQTNTEQAWCSFVRLSGQVLFICSGSTRMFFVCSVHGPPECSRVWKSYVHHSSPSEYQLRKPW